jgi:ribosome biogenesis GTPase / thiamine phosphate phosphatase
MAKKSRSERQHEKDLKKHGGKQGGTQSASKKQKLKQVIKKWSKGGETKWSFNPNAIDDDDSASFERSSDIAKLHNRQNANYTQSPEKTLTDLSGVVYEAKGLSVWVRTDDGDYDCKPFRSTVSENPDSTLLAVGDDVIIKPLVQPLVQPLAKPLVQPTLNQPTVDPPDVEKRGEGLITTVKARRTKLYRSRDRRMSRSGEPELVIAANISQIFIMASITEPMMRKGLIDRYLAFAEYESLKPILLVNKIDLESRRVVESEVKIYRELGYDVMLISVEKNIGIDALKSKLIGETSVISGHSGVGKTTLVNLLTGSDLAVGDVSEKNLKGAHTTSNAVMLELKTDAGTGRIIDTPGIREFGLSWIPREELRHCFIEFRPLAPDCAFPSCSHTTEPGCAVIAALERGEIAPERYDSYLALFDSATE